VSATASCIRRPAHPSPAQPTPPHPSQAKQSSKAKQSQDLHSTVQSIPAKHSQAHNHHEQHSGAAAAAQHTDTNRETHGRYDGAASCQHTPAAGVIITLHSVAHDHRVTSSPQSLSLHHQRDRASDAKAIAHRVSTSVSEHLRLSFCPSVCLSVTEKACPFVRQLMSGWTTRSTSVITTCARVWGRRHDARCRKPPSFSSNRQQSSR